MLKSRNNRKLFVDIITTTLVLFPFSLFLILYPIIFLSLIFLTLVGLYFHKEVKSFIENWIKKGTDNQDIF